MVALPLQSLAVHPIDRRRDERQQLGLQVTVTFTTDGYRWTETDAEVLDVSSTGMFARCDRVPREGHRVLVGFMLPDGNLCAAAGRPVRFDGWGGFGVRFESANQPLLDFLRDLERVDPRERAQLVAGARDARVWIE